MNSILPLLCCCQSSEKGQRRISSALPSSTGPDDWEKSIWNFGQQTPRTGEHSEELQGNQNNFIQNIENPFTLTSSILLINKSIPWTWCYRYHASCFTVKIMVFSRMCSYSLYLYGWKLRGRHVHSDRSSFHFAPTLTKYSVRILWLKIR